MKAKGPTTWRPATLKKGAFIVKFARIFAADAKEKSKGIKTNVLDLLRSKTDQF
jgi:hypothetical protein